MFGSTLHVLVDDAAARAPELRRYLADIGIANAEARKIDASLEDSFVHLVSAKPELTEFAR